MQLGFFPYLDIAALALFLPSWFWDRVLLPWMKTRRRTGLRLYYDADCGFCKRSIFVLHQFLLFPEAPVLTAQSDPAVHKLMREANSWVVVDAQGRPRTRFDAFLAMLEASPLFWPLAPVLWLPPLFALGSSAYGAVASHRPLAGRLTGFLSFRPLKTGTPAWAQVVAALALAYCAALNVSSLKPDFWKPPAALHCVGHALYLDQHWRMFSPRPLEDDGWYVVIGTLADGTETDLLRDGPVRWEKPASVADTYPNHRWRKYLANLAQAKRDRSYREAYARYLARDWKRRHPEAPAERQLERIEIWFMLEKTLPDGVAEPKPMRLWRHYCSEAAKAKLAGRPERVPPALKA
jgi:predicted DCC family thiol-disulfide oxidoreductase YuxK